MELTILERVDPWGTRWYWTEVDTEWAEFFNVGPGAFATDLAMRCKDFTVLSWTKLH